MLVITIITLIISTTVESSAKRITKSFDDIFLIKVTTDPRYSDSSYILILKHGKVSSREIKLWTKEIEKNFFDAKAIILVDYADVAMDNESWNYVFAKQETSYVSLDTAKVDSAFSVKRYVRQAWSGLEKLDNKVGASGWLIIVSGLVILALGLWLGYKLIKVIVKDLKGTVIWSLSVTKSTFKKINDAYKKAKKARQLKLEQRRATIEAAEAERKAQAIKKRDEKQIELPSNLAEIAKIIINQKLTGTVYNCPFCKSHGIKHDNLKDHYFKKCVHTKGNDIRISTIRVNMLSDYSEPKKTVS